MKKKTKEKITHHKILIDEFKRTFPIYILGIVFFSVVMLILYKIPAIVGEILDMVLEGDFTFDEIIKKVYELIFYSVIFIIPRAIYRTMFFTRARVSDTYLRKKVVEHLQDVKPSYYDNETKGAFLAYLSKEIFSIRKFLGNVFREFSRIFIAPILGLVYIGADFNFILTLSVLPLIPLAIIRIVKLQKDQKLAIEKARVAYLKMSETIEQNTAGFSLIKSYNEQTNQKQKFDKINTETKTADFEIGVVKNKISNTVNILYAGCYSVGFIVGLILIKNNKLTPGELTAFFSCITLILSGMVSAITPFTNGLVYFRQATNRFNYFFNLKKIKSEGENLEEFEELRLNNLNFSYDKNNILQNIDLSIKKGEKIGIVGQVGSGKTTLLNIISGFSDVLKDSYFINGIDINDYNVKSIYSKINFCMQKNIVIDDTIRKNVDIDNSHTDEEIFAVLKSVGFDKDLKTMPKKLDTIIGENGVKVSGGQKQRLQIARTLLNIREINIFDDTLSALDSNTENFVLDEILKAVGNNTLIIVSNKLSVMDKMDKVYLLIGGQIVGNGTHKELLDSNAFYNEIYALEKGVEDEEDC